MEKTTIYLSGEIKEHLIDLAAKMRREKRKRVAMTDIIREALKEYMRKKGIRLEGKDKVIRRMLSTRGALDSNEFEKRVLAAGYQHKRSPLHRDSNPGMMFRCCHSAC